MTVLNKRGLIFFCALVSALCVIFSSSFKDPSDNFTRLEDGIIIKVKKAHAGGASFVKIQAVTDKIIHVTATAADTFSSTPGLMVVDKKRSPVKW